MHLETMRFALWRESIGFLMEEDEGEQFEQSTQTPAALRI
jgi:hypothetical protein